MPSPQPAQSPAIEPSGGCLLEDLAHALDDAVGGRVLVFGSPPPDARDLDLLAREAELEAISSRLSSEGMLRRGVSWIALRSCSAVAVDLVPACDWRLPQAELEHLFDQAEPIPGFRNLVSPAPHHALLIAARRVARAGRYQERLRRRVSATLDRYPPAWQDAARSAGAWDCVAALQALRTMHASGSQPSGAARARSLATRLRGLPAHRGGARRAARRAVGRPVVVALCGLDGAGKSFQSAHLQAALDRLGYRAVVIWPPAANVLFQANPALKRRLFAVLRTLGRPERASNEAPAAFTEPAAEPLPRQSAAVAHALALMVALAQAWALRRGAAAGAARQADVVIYDRYVLDSVVYLRHRWGHGRSFPLQSALIRLLARRPARAFLLDLPAAVAYARKQDFPIENLRERGTLYRELYRGLGCVRLDAEAPPEQLCAQIARSVWERLP